MSKVTTLSNFRVVVEPKTHIYGIALRESTVKKDCEEIVEQIKRHVDNVHSVSLEYDTDITCSHCGYGWEEEMDGEPLCCDKAVEEFKHQKQPS